jgi:hypothetical protein
LIIPSKTYFGPHHNTFFFHITAANSYNLTTSTNNLIYVLARRRKEKIETADIKDHVGASALNLKEYNREKR